VAGESFDIVMWCAPDAEKLGRCFELLESAAIVAVQAGASEDGKSAGNIDVGLSNILGVARDMLKKREKVARPRPAGSWYGASGLQLPNANEYMELAHIVSEALLRRPVAELAASTSLCATHANNRPVLSPQLGPEVNISRVSPSGSADKDGPELGVVFAGTVSVDVETSGFLEMVASAPALVSGLFDDTRRRRSADMKARGLWPQDIYGKPLTPREVFGFDVDPNGRVNLVPESAVFLRLEGLPLPPLATNPDGLSRLDLSELQMQAAQIASQRQPQIDALTKARQELEDLRGEAAAPPQIGAGRKVDGDQVALARRQISTLATALAELDGQGICRASVPNRPPDGKARQVTAIVSAGSRYSSAMVTRVDEVLEPDQQTRSSSVSKPLSLPALRRPDRLEPRTLLPSFVWRQSVEIEGRYKTLVSRRHSKVRIRVRRPWFTSGEGERLGIVVWPPELLSDPNFDATADLANLNGQEMNMTGYDDKDIGPGGAFVSRWGADPIQPGPQPSGWLMRPEMFFHDRYEATGFMRAIVPPPVMMPLPSDPNASTASGQLPNPPLLVSLITYEPRFDIDEELWYVDLTLDTLGIQQPFVRLGIVRYQENAPPELKVSEPVVEWVQPLPHREARVTCISRGPTKGEKGDSKQNWEARVRVKGQYADRADPKSRLNPGVIPSTIKFQVVCSTVNGTVGLTERKVGAADVLARISPEDGGLLWDCVMALPEEPFAAARDGRVYSILVEEVYSLPRSTILNEYNAPGPLSGGSGSSSLKQGEPVAIELQESGPRYAARIELTPSWENP